MYPQEIKDEIRKLNWVDRIGLYRWINEEIAGPPGIGADLNVIPAGAVLRNTCFIALFAHSFIDAYGNVG
jgi:hypothetical protein